MEKVCILGLGYIGLPTAAVMAAHGYKVIGVDVKPEVIDTINAGKIHIVEPDLDKAVKTAVESGNLRASLTPEEADAFIIAVPTPFIENHHAPVAERYKADMRYVRKAAETVAKYLKAGDVVILESTSPIGATRADVAEVIEAARPDLKGQLHIAHCPERVLPGKVLFELIENSRIVGGLTPEATKKAADIYRRFVKGAILETTAETAEMAKLTENAFRDVNIAFANELSLICETLGINVWELIRLANHHPRVNILNPGPCVGGHCIAVDPWFIVAAAPEESRLIQTARLVNDGKPTWVVDKVKEAAAKEKQPVVALLGLAYKPDVDDLRESPSVTIAKALKGNVNARIVVCEPYVKQFEDFEMADLDSALDAANIVVMLTDHTPFKAISPERLKNKQVIDTRGTFDGR